MNFVVLMDPLENVIYEKDTSFILMKGASNNKHRTFFLPDGGIARTNGRTTFHVTEVVPQDNKDNPFRILENLVLNEDDVDVILIRTDPPFDNNYLTNTWFLDLLPERIVVLNAPSGIRTVNEKIWATQFNQLLPDTYVGRNQSDMQEFFKKHKKIVAKPTDGFGGKSIFILEENDSNVKVILETLTENNTRDIILQKFVPESTQGDKRIILLNGDPLGAVLRVHSIADHRNNFFTGGRAEKTVITKRDLEIIATLKPYLQKLGLHFVGIDIMGPYLIEVNVTSPTCLQEMNHLYDLNLENKVIDYIENLSKIK